MLFERYKGYPGESVAFIAQKIRRQFLDFWKWEPQYEWDAKLMSILTGGQVEGESTQPEIAARTSPVVSLLVSWLIFWSAAFPSYIFLVPCGAATEDAESEKKEWISQRYVLSEDFLSKGR